MTEDEQQGVATSALNTGTDAAIEAARTEMYRRTSGYFTLEEQDKLRTWVDATLAEVKKQAKTVNARELTRREAVGVE